MNIGLLAVDSQYPNLALMKISAYHKKEGNSVEWYNPLSHYDKCYMAKVFSFAPDYGYYIHADEVEKGGTGYDLHKTLSEEIDRLQPELHLSANRFQNRLRVPDTRMSEQVQVVHSPEERRSYKTLYGRGGYCR